MMDAGVSMSLEHKKTPERPPLQEAQKLTRLRPLLVKDLPAKPASGPCDCETNYGHRRV